MADQLQLRGGTTAEHATFTGALREVTVDTDKDTIVVHDNATAGGRPLLREDLSNLPAGTIDNADINASAAIAGTKVAPDFGSQNVVTTGTATAASLSPTGSSVPTNGVYLPAANSVAISTNGTNRLHIASDGKVGLGTSSPSFATHISAAKNTSQLFVGITGLSSVDDYAQIGLGSGSTPYGFMRLGFDNPAGVTNTYLSFYNNNGSSNVERVRIDSSGRVGIGTTSPGYALDVASSVAQVGNSTDAFIQYKSTAGNWHVGAGNANAFVVYSGTYGTGSEKARIDSSGRLLVGTSSALSNSWGGSGQVQLSTNSFSTSQIYSFTSVGADGYGSYFELCRARGTQASPSVVSSGDELAEINFYGHDGSTFIRGASIRAYVDGTPGTNDMPGRLVFSTSSDNSASPTERMRIKSTGAISMGPSSSSSTAPNDASGAGYGAVAVAPSGALDCAVSNTTVAFFNRCQSDGDIIAFKQDANTEGTISVSGTTVSYNGAHLSRWSQLPGGAEREDILRGTLLSNIDEMCAWGEEDNEQLNRMKVSDVEGDPNVSGVFQAWDDDDDTYTNDFYCAMTGDFIIRIAEGVTVQRGDLLMSAGDGTAKPQGDGFVQDKTIAKVTSTHVTCTYDDGSYCVPCVLMAC